MNGNVPSAGVFAIAASACKCLVFLHYRVPISHFDSVIFFSCFWVLLNLS